MRKEYRRVRDHKYKCLFDKDLRTAKRDRSTPRTKFGEGFRFWIERFLYGR